MSISRDADGLTHRQANQSAVLMLAAALAEVALAMNQYYMYINENE